MHSAADLAAGCNIKRIGRHVMCAVRFVDENGVFTMEQPENYSYLYFPIAGEDGIKSSLTPNLGGDIKISQNAILNGTRQCGKPA